MEPRWMQGKTVGFFLEVFRALVLEVAVSHIRPYTHSPVTTASGDEVFLDTDVKPIDRLGMER
jgi:hypothetical protein